MNIQQADVVPLLFHIHLPVFMQRIDIAYHFTVYHISLMARPQGPQAQRLQDKQSLSHIKNMLSIHNPEREGTGEV